MTGRDWLTRITDGFGSVRGVVVQFVVEAVYILIFGAAFGVDRYPFQFLTLVLSLQAITMTQLVMIVQNRQGALIEAKADADRANNAEDLRIDRDAAQLLAQVAKSLGVAWPEPSP